MGETKQRPKSGGIEEAPILHRPKLSVIPLVALIFYEVSGGPFGVEDSVKAGGPLLAILGFVIFPFIWSIPEALVTAELATAFPDNGGYVLWISAAFGPFWGFQEGFWKWLSGVIDNALYPVLFLDYVKHSFPIVSAGPTRFAALAVTTFGLTYLNYRGLTIVGFTAIGLAIFSLLPFCALGILAIPRIRPQKWLAIDLHHTNWRGYFNSLFWNLNFWDKASTLAGEVEKPREAFPKALFAAVLLVVFSYLIPLLAGTGALDTSKSDWEDGYFADVALAIGGVWLKWWVEIAAALSNMGLFEAEMSSDAFQLLGMGERGMLPLLFAQRSKYGTPIWGIVFSSTGVIMLSWMSFQEIIEFLNFLYSFGMLLEFAAFIWLRLKQPELPRPFRVPLNTTGVILMCFPPSALLILVMCIASAKTIIVGVAVALVGLLLYPTIEMIKQKKWLRFAEDAGLTALQAEELSSAAILEEDEDSEAEIGLLSS
ncbi:hypothetical protein O6H91_20G043700 [Diphasiastrum complanatum]|uniref:Uncharacterized protein n=1 Tax=Diphasiastrum complanatum TaxID=34168 RepID=A0ACC2APS2_DIPCM|nr:hypothetical protein O6H91_20G043700 [Diphasiastrum complanatum]